MALDRKKQGQTGSLAQVDYQGRMGVRERPAKGLRSEGRPRAVKPGELWDGCGRRVGDGAASRGRLSGDTLLLRTTRQETSPRVVPAAAAAPQLCWGLGPFSRFPLPHAPQPVTTQCHRQGLG